MWAPAWKSDESEAVLFEAGCLSGLPCSSGAAPRRPQASSDLSVNIIGLDYLQVPSSSVITLPGGAATEGFSVSPTSVARSLQAKICGENPSGPTTMGLHGG